MGGDVRIGGNQTAVGIGQDALGRAGFQGVEVGAGGFHRPEHGLVKLFGQSAGQALHQLIIQGGHIAAELVGKRHNDGQGIGRHLLGGQSAALDRLFLGLSDPARFGVSGDNGDGYAQAGKRNLPGQCHDGAGFLGFLQNFAGHAARQGNSSRAVDVNSCHNCSFTS